MTRVLPGVGKYASLIIAAVFVILPLSVVLFASFKSSKEYGSTGPLTPPVNWFNFENFATAFTSGDMVEGFVNTTVVLIISLTGTIIIGTMAAYAIDRFQFRGRKLIMGLFLVATLIPSVTSQVATFQIISGLGLFNTKAAQIGRASCRERVL